MLKLVIICSYVVFAAGLKHKVSGQLNFEDKPSKSIVRRQSSEDTQLENLGIICGTGGCNITKPNKDSSVETDVVVRVKTKVDLKNATQKSVVDDTTDIPIVVGYKSTNIDPNFIGRNTFTPVTTFQNHQKPVYFHNSDNPNLRKNNYPFYSTIPKTFYPRIQPEARRIFNTESNEDSAFHMNGIEIRVPYYQPTFNSPYFGETPPPQYVSLGKTNSNNFVPNTFDVSQPTFVANSPQFLPVSKQASSNNYFTPPTATQLSQNWKPLVYNIKEIYVPELNREANCRCPGNGYSSIHRRGDFNTDPGSQINDKLDPLN